MPWNLIATTSFTTSTNSLAKMFLLSVVCVLLGFASSYPSGAPEETCHIFTANHTGHLPQKSRAPFQLIASPSAVAPGGTVTVTLQGTHDETFKGFFIQGQEQATKNPVGKFQQQSGSQTRDCSGPGSKNAVTHVDAGDKTIVTFKWKAPTSFQGTLVFRAVVVKTYQLFWNDIVSNQLIVS